MAHKYRFNRYNDLEIDVAQLVSARSGTDCQVQQEVAQEINEWKRKIRCRPGADAALMWLRTPAELARLVPCIRALDFEIHHACRDHVMLVRRLGDRATIPDYGTHYARVECVVVEAGTGRMLVVAERAGPGHGSPKLVTGSVSSGEHLAVAAAREVKEEAGIEARFVGVLGLANRLGTRFGKDEILVGALLSAEPNQHPHPDDREVTRAEWVAPDEAFRCCGPLARQWLAAAASGQPPLRYGSLPDYFRRDTGNQIELHAGTM